HLAVDHHGPLSATQLYSRSAETIGDSAGLRELHDFSAVSGTTISIAQGLRDRWISPATRHGNARGVAEKTAARPHINLQVPALAWRQCPTPRAERAYDSASIRVR